VVSFTLYPRRKSLLYPLDRRLGGPQNRSARRGADKILTLPGLEILPLGRRACSQSLYLLSYPGSSQICTRHRISVVAKYDVTGSNINASYGEYVSLKRCFLWVTLRSCQGLDSLMNWKESGRKCSWSKRGTLPKFAWKD
jgi:hypothetical protein